MARVACLEEPVLFCSMILIARTARFSYNWCTSCYMRKSLLDNSEGSIEVERDIQAWEKLTHAEKNHQLCLQQKETLDQFLKTGAISQEQHDKSLRDLKEKMNEQ